LGDRSERLHAARAAAALVITYAARRSQKVRAQAIELCDDVSQKLSEVQPAMARRKAVLVAEGQLHELSAQSTALACRSLVLAIDDEEAPERDDATRQLAALERATLAHALIQLAVHFPEALAAVELDVSQALSQAFYLAEEAILLAPELPDGHAALARALLCRDDADEEAEEAARAALACDPEHDPAHAVIANLMLSRGDTEGALAVADALLRRGCMLPQALLLHATILAALGRYDEARVDIDRALRVAPEAPALYAEGARIARLAGDAPSAEQLQTRALAVFDDGEATKPDIER
jgi:tetratricopeptide (TPR) repeat protein